ncbi:hypothetical protein BM221_000041 [Beauveria bassiana]|uniref:Uncharacterized protein n=1 Tax=Beauveria bassiana TaxID=176275 RepID=A0A2N6NZB4_BEABA|nr:hypothetical protein BM221_000041 [Beauveria bassiana]
MAAGAQNVQGSSEFFQSIGNKVEGLAPKANGDHEDLQPVEEIESLCMNCHENVGLLSGTLSTSTYI